MGGSAKKVPNRALIPQHTGKKAVPRSALQGPEDKRLTWRFSLMDWEGPYSWEVCTLEEWRTVKKRLGVLEKLTGRDLENMGCHHLSNCGQRLNGTAIHRLEETGRQVFIDDLWSFAIERAFGCDGNVWKRVICIHVAMCMYLLWWDPKHEVYPPIPRN